MQRWQAIEADLKANGITEDDKLNRYFSDYYTALYFLTKEQSPSGYMLRALYDSATPILAQRRTDAESVPYFVLLLSSFIGKGVGTKNFLEVSAYLREQNVLLQTLLPGYPLCSNEIKPDTFGRVLSHTHLSDLLYGLSGWSQITYDLLMHTGYKPHVFSKSLARDRFFENYCIDDPYGSLTIARVDGRDVLFRVKEMAIQEGVGMPSILLNGVEVSAICRSHKKKLSPEEKARRAEEIAAKIKKSGRAQRRDYAPVVRSNATPIIGTLLDLISLQLKKHDLPELTFYQKHLTAYYLLWRMEIWQKPLVCENYANQVKLQEQETNFEYLKELDASFFTEPDKFDPAKLFHYHDPREIFGNCIYDTLNDFLMPIGSESEKEHPAYADEQAIKKAVLKAIAKDTPCMKVHFRAPQPLSDDCEHEVWYFYSLKDLKLGNREYHGKQPLQGWSTVLCRTYYSCSKANAKAALSDTAENFKQARTVFFEENARDLDYLRDPYTDGEIDLVSVLKENFLDNYSMGIIVGSQGTMPGFVQTTWLNDNGKYEVVNGQHLSLPTERKESKEPEIYLCSLPYEELSFINLLSLSDFGSQIFDFYTHVHEERIFDLRYAAVSDDYQEFDNLRKLMQNILRILHNRQSDSTNQVQLSSIRDLINVDLIYHFDAIVLVALLYNFAFGVTEIPKVNKATKNRRVSLYQRPLNLGNDDESNEDESNEESNDDDDVDENDESLGDDEIMDDSILDEFNDEE